MNAPSPGAPPHPLASGWCRTPAHTPGRYWVRSPRADGGWNAPVVFEVDAQTDVSKKAGWQWWPVPIP